MTTEDPVGRLPAPGDLFVLAATADLPVEWAILDRRPSGELLAVPADTCPLAGSADVEVEEGAPGGPLVLRCRFGVWLAAGVFDPDLRTGSLAAETVADALHCWRQGEAGRGEASPLAEEVDADPEYVDWIRDVPERARDLAVAARPVRRKDNPPARSWTAYRLAAALALISIGLSVWVGQLRREVDRLKEPIFNAHSEEVSLGSTVRGPSDVRIPPEAEHVRLVLVVVDPDLEEGEGRLEILDRDDRLVWRSPRIEIVPGDDFPVIIRRELLPDGEYRVRLYQGSGPHVAEETVRIETVVKR
ncbi:MAG TPA: hypothetical protein VLE27_09750 [Thermoanaerobaculia bacterium]|nr:hypothetical protein [Thermoanaerobaculia bacterium]